MRLLRILAKRREYKIYLLVGKERYTIFMGIYKWVFICVMSLFFGLCLPAALWTFTLLARVHSAVIGECAYVFCVLCVRVSSLSI